MSLNDHFLKAIHHVVYQHIQENEPLTLEQLAAAVHSTPEQIIEFFKGRLGNSSDLGTWRELLQWLGHWDNGVWMNFPGNWFWREIYQNPGYDYHDNLARHKTTAAFQSGTFEGWRMKGKQN